MTNTKFSYFGILIVFVLIIIYTDDEYVSLTKKNIYKTVVAKPIEWITKDRDLDRFRANHQKIVNGQLPLKLSINKLDSNGYGNRVYSMLTSFVIAILTDSAFFVNNWDVIGKYIDEPANFTFRYDQLDELRTSAAAFPETRIDPSQGWSITKDLDVITSYTLPSNVPIFTYEALNAHFMTICSNPDNYQKLYDVGLVDKDTIDTAVDKLGNPEYSKETKLNSVLEVGFEVGGNLLAKYWKPNAKLSALTKKYDKMFDEYFMIGLQVRTEFVDFEEEFRLFLECAFHIEQVIDEELEVKWFLASDQSTLIDELDAEYPGKLVKVAETDLDGWERAILDNELLSQCDEIVTTGGSTFGFVAAMRAIQMPFYVNGRANMTKCKRTTLDMLPARGQDASFKKRK